MLATVFLAQGTPMLLAGDEFGRTQNGNNNAYCQDNEMSWIDWTLAESDEGRLLTDFVARVIALRHEHPILRCASFLHGKDEPAPDVLDIAWFDEQGEVISAEAWNNPAGAHAGAAPGRRRCGRQRSDPDLLLQSHAPRTAPSSCRRRSCRRRC